MRGWGGWGWVGVGGWVGWRSGWGGVVQGLGPLTMGTCEGIGKGSWNESNLAAAKSVGNEKWNEPIWDSLENQRMDGFSRGHSISHSLTGKIKPLVAIKDPWCCSPPTSAWLSNVFRG